jgi:hypothetical protein
MKQFAKYIGGALVLMILAGSALAAQIPMTFVNVSDADTIYFFITDPTRYTFDDKKLTNSAFLPGSLPSSWGVDVIEPDRLIVSGDPLAPGAGTFTLDMFGAPSNSQNTVFTVEWAEVLNGTITQSATLQITGRGTIVGTPVYGPITSEVPIPDAYWLLGSGLILFVAIRRKKEESAVAY